MANGMYKLPINKEIPLYIGEDEIEAYGEQVWAYVKNPNLAYGFITYDKYMRRTPCWWTDFGGEFVEPEYWDKLVPISEVSAEHLIPRGETKFVPTDTTNYDHLFDIPVDPETPVEPEDPTVEPGGTNSLMKLLQVIIDIFKKIISLFKK